MKDTEIYQIEVAQNDISTKLILDKKAKELPILTRGNNLAIRYCEKCKCLKPDRAHHCGVCQTCVLKMVNILILLYKKQIFTINFY